MVLENQHKGPQERRVWDYVEVLASEKTIPNLLEAIERGKKEFSGDFYVSDAGKLEELLPGVLKSHWLTLNACPTPNYDNILFKYIKDTEQIVEIWVIPPWEGVEYMLNNRLEVVSEEQDLLGYCIAFRDGSLDRMAHFLNGEKEGGDHVVLEVVDDSQKQIIMES